ncbi:unnamed protein product [Arctogadus glacialis]
MGLCFRVSLAGTQRHPGAPGEIGADAMEESGHVAVHERPVNVKRRDVAGETSDQSRLLDSACATTAEGPRAWTAFPSETWKVNGIPCREFIQFS